MFKKLFSALVFLALAGCANFNVKENYALTPGSGKGLLVMSLFDTGSGSSQLDYRRLGSQAKEEDGSIMIGNIQDAPDWTAPRGRLVVAELPAGQYEFFRWIHGKNMSVRYNSIKPFSIPFTVSEGKAVYVGSLLIDMSEANRTFKMSLVDQSERDIALLLSRYKNIKAEQVSREITAVK